MPVLANAHQQGQTGFEASHSRSERTTALQQLSPNSWFVAAPYTLVGIDAAAAINATLFDNLSFNVAWDIAVVGMNCGRLDMVVHPSVSAETVPEFIAYAKASPGKINIGMTD